MKKWLSKRWVYHSLIWIGFTFGVGIIPVIINPEVDYLESIGGVMIYFIPMVPLVYANFYLKSQLYEKRKYLTYAICVILLLVSGIGLYQGVYYFFPNYDQHPLQDASNVFFLIAITTGLQYLKRGVIGQFQLQELKAKTAQMELNALKAQVNPHFLFNTLNNIYATNRKDAVKGSEMIMELAEVMRYHLRFAESASIPLEDEIQLISSYIELEKLRQNANFKLTIELPDDQLASKQRIEPLIFLPFVENAFKYGTHPTQPCFIDLKLRLNEARLDFEIRNTVIRNKKTVKTGLGIENIRKRLSIIYPEKHSLVIRSTEEEFQVNLTIQL